MAKSKPRALVVAGLGIGQILAWGSSYYLLAVLAEPVTTETGWPSTLVVAGLSIGLVISGLASPRVGSRIGQGHGRRVLLLSAALLAAGLAIMATAPTLVVYLVAWLVIGLGMGMGLYTSAFATLGQLYGPSARTSITALTLFGGFASTICWPLSTFLVSEIGWRGTCGVYAALHLVVTIPLYLWAVPRSERPEPRAETPATETTSANSAPQASDRVTLVLVGSIVTLGGLVSTAMSVHVFTLLGASGLAFDAALTIAVLVGPSQVGARLVELLIAHRHHPIWTLVASAGLVAASLSLLAGGIPLFVLIMILYGAGIGLASVARGTVPLAMFAPRRYAKLMGRIALPALLAQAAAPSLGAVLIDTIGARNTLTALALAAALNVGLVAWLALMNRKWMTPNPAQPNRETVGR